MFADNKHDNLLLKSLETTENTVFWDWPEIESFPLRPLSQSPLVAIDNPNDTGLAEEILTFAQDNIFLNCKWCPDYCPTVISSEM
jgi:hypothetical protein